MKLYKGDRVMLSVGKEQVDICLEAGWSRTKPEPKPEVVEEEKETTEDTTKPEEVDPAPGTDAEKAEAPKKRQAIPRAIKRK